jgi:hypothetical protein
VKKNLKERKKLIFFQKSLNKTEKGFGGLQWIQMT